MVANSVQGGIFVPPLRKIWWAVVDRQGVLCDVDKIGDAWPDSHAKAIAKAGTANGFSNESLALSTANLYAATQPGGLLYGLNNSNPFDAHYLTQKSGIGFVTGGIITFGGGVALYQGSTVIGGLGISGDTPCVDHAIAFNMRTELNLTPAIPTPVPVGFNLNDDISYPRGDNRPSGFQHPKCRFDIGRGRDGRDGKDGHDGKDGKDGKDGRDGRDGKDGGHGKDSKDSKDDGYGKEGKSTKDNKPVKGH